MGGFRRGTRLDEEGLSDLCSSRWEPEIDESGLPLPLQRTSSRTSICPTWTDKLHPGRLQLAQRVLARR